jgi:hypothetical protein
MRCEPRDAMRGLEMRCEAWRCDANLEMRCEPGDAMRGLEIRCKSVDAMRT